MLYPALPKASAGNNEKYNPASSPGFKKSILNPKEFDDFRGGKCHYESGDTPSLSIWNARARLRNGVRPSVQAACETRCPKSARLGVRAYPESDPNVDPTWGLSPNARHVAFCCKLAFLLGLAVLEFAPPDVFRLMEGGPEGLESTVGAAHPCGSPAVVHPFFDLAELKS